MVQISMDLPESNSKTVAPTDMSVMLTLDGNMTYNGRPITLNQLSSKVSSDRQKSTNQENATISIIAEKGVKWERIEPVMNVAKRLKMRAIMATKARKQ